MICPKCKKHATSKKREGSRVIYIHAHYVDQQGKLVKTICIKNTES